MKDILSGERRALKVKEVEHLYVPYYKTLTIESMLEFAGQFENVRSYFPDDRDLPNLPRQVSERVLF